MQHVRNIKGVVFEVSYDLIEVTSMHRPDVSWHLIDIGGHEHCWYDDSKPATVYNPTTHYTTPTLVWVHDGTGYYEDGEPYEIGHHQCQQCGQHITPRYTADDCTQMIPGMRSYRIDGEYVSPEEFEQRLRDAKGQ
jgi:hypothetical protein